MSRNAVLPIIAVLLTSLLVTAAVQAQSTSTATDAESVKQDFQPALEAPSSLDDVTSGQLLLTHNGRTVAAPIQTAVVEIDITGVVSKVRFTQTFQNTSDNWVEGLYRFPLPDEAAVRSMVIHVGDRRVVGKIEEKAVAEGQYEEAKKAGQVASLVSQHRPNLFSSKVANIGPRQTVSIELEYLQTLSLENQRYRLRIPTTLTPRYRNGVSGNALELEPNFVTANAVSAEKPAFSVSIIGRLHGAITTGSLVSPTHALAINQQSGVTQFELAHAARLDRDFIMHWQQGVDDAAQLNAWRETVEGDDYVLAVIAPPNQQHELPAIPRELVIVVDTSGSMAGQPMQAAKAALVDALMGLKPDDTFNVIEFNSSYSALFNQPLPATGTNIERGLRFARQLQADGGTEMRPALQYALSHSNRQEALQQVVFITDGAVGFEDDIIKLVTGQLRSARLFTVGIGSAPNTWFMKKVAEAGRGTASFITDVSDTQRVMEELFFTLESPALTDVSLTFDDAAVEYFPRPVPDLYAASPVVVAAKITPNTKTLKLTGRMGDSAWSQELDLTDLPRVESGLSTVWARKKIAGLEDEQRLLNDVDYYESLITSIALEHQLLTRYTSFVAVEDSPSRPIHENLETASIPNLIPHGSTMQAVQFPNGSAGTDTALWLAWCLLLLAALSAAIHRHRMHQRRTHQFRIQRLAAP